jgi:beta-aspartyl-peptidase (threonine type)
LYIAGILVVPVLAAQAQQPRPATDRPPANVRTVLVIHGGAGVLTPDELKAAGLKAEDFEQALARALWAGYQQLQRGKSSVDAVEAAIRNMEDCELFNAGRGAVFNGDGQVELDASIMDGNMQGQGEGKRDPRRRAGAVAGVRHIKNPISAARAVMEMESSRHVLLIGEGAERYALSEPVASKYGIERVSNLYFWTDRRVKQIREAHRREEARRAKSTAASGAEADEVADNTAPALHDPDARFGTVGAVAVDANKHIAAGTSTGGMTNKMAGRVGDSPIIGAGTYADDRACGVSCTGTGEIFIRHAVAYDIVAHMLYAGKTVHDAVRETTLALPDEEEGIGSLIALDAQGRHAFGITPKTPGMFRGYITSDGQMYVGMYTGEEKRVQLQP